MKDDEVNINISSSFWFINSILKNLYRLLFIKEYKCILVYLWEVKRDIWNFVEY